MITAAVHLATTTDKPMPSDFLLYVLYPTLVASLVGTGAAAVRFGKRLSTQDQALAQLLREVVPKGQPSLREVVQSNQEELRLVKQRQGDRWEYVQDALAQLHHGVPVKPPPDGG